MAQEILNIGAQHHCNYYGQPIPEVLYSYPTESLNYDYIRDEILNKTNSAYNFEFIWSNVPSLTAVEDRGKRYILYSRRFLHPLLKKEDDKILAYAMIAHAIGHHANEHRLLEASHFEDEIEADEYMGYALALLGFNLEDVERIPTKLVQTNGLDIEDRIKAILRGYKKGDTCLRNSEHASFYENNIDEVLRNFPRFDLPPPQWSADADLDFCFMQCSRLSDVERVIRQAMDATGYFSRKYFWVEKGFAMVTRLEQFNPDGTCKRETDRWNSKAVSSESFSVLDYLYSLFVPQPGYFRVIVFVVTPTTFNANTAKFVSRDEASGWLNEGRNRLPDVIGNQPFLPGKTSVTALVYEFISKESDNKLHFRKTSNIEGIMHIKNSGLLEKLKR